MIVDTLKRTVMFWFAAFVGFAAAVATFTPTWSLPQCAAGMTYVVDQYACVHSDTGSDSLRGSVGSPVCHDDEVAVAVLPGDEHLWRPGMASTLCVALDDLVCGKGYALTRDEGCVR